MVTDSSDERHVFVMAVDGSRETIVVAHPSQNVIMGRSPDGQRLLFSSDRSGSFGLWAVAVDDGTPQEPRPWSNRRRVVMVAGIDGLRNDVRVEVREPDLCPGVFG